MASAYSQTRLLGRGRRVPGSGCLTARAGVLAGGRGGVPDEDQVRWHEFWTLDTVAVLRRDANAGL
jgi:hypothetical protein